MSKKHVKHLIKSAKEKIITKDYYEALDICNDVLQIDSRNYTAYVFRGRCLSEGHNSDDVINAYESAISISPHVPLAWQGLSDYYAKHDAPGYNIKHINCLSKLIEILECSGSPDVLFGVRLKLADAYANSNKFEQALDIYISLLDSNNHSLELSTKILKVISSKRLLPDNVKDRIIEIVQLTDSGSITNTTLIKYLRLLESRSYDLEKIYGEYERLHNVDDVHEELDTFLANLVLKAYFSNTTNLLNFSNPLPFSKFCDWFVSKFPKLPQALVMQALNDYQLESSSILNADLPDTIEGMMLKLYSYTLTHYYCHAVQLLVESISEYIKESPYYTLCSFNLITIVNYWNLLSLLESRAEDDKKKCIDIISILKETDIINKDVLSSILARVYIQQSKFDECGEILLSYVPKSLVDYDLIKSNLLFAENKFDEVVRVLEGNSSSEGLYLLGKTYWNIHGSKLSSKSQCLSYLLKSAKLDPFRSDTFRLLGLVFQHIRKDNQKAEKLYERAFNLDKSNHEASSALGELIFSQRGPKEALKFYESVIVKTTGLNVGLAWLRLGLAYLRDGNPNAAINALQTYQCANPLDIICLESLGDAYLTRGSYMSAMNAFAKAISLDSNNIYCIYQIARINYSLGEYSNSILKYKEVLVINPKYIPALKGITESYYHLAKRCLLKSLYSQCLSYIESAISMVKEALACNHGFLCLWKLLGDCCSLGGRLNPKSLDISGALLGHEDSQCVSVGKDKLLEVALNAYTQALKLFPENSACWHDLAVTWFHVNPKSDLPAQCARKAISLRKDIPQYWVTMATVSYEDAALSERCFKHAISLDANDVTAWTGLGVLKLYSMKIQEAHKAFSNAQSINPTYTQCWLGQAVVAHSIDHKDCIDLYRHTTQLAYHPESAIGYSQCVCNLLSYPNSVTTEVYDHAIKRMGALQEADICLTKYCESYPDSLPGLSMHGFLKVALGLFQSALGIYTKCLEVALKGADSSESGAADIHDSYLNLARCLYFRQKFEKSLELFQNARSLKLVPKAQQPSAIDLAFMGAAAFHAAKYDVAIDCFKCAASNLKGRDKADILCAIGTTLLRLNDVESAKKLLLTSSEMCDGSPAGCLKLLAFCSTTGKVPLGYEVYKSISQSHVIQKESEIFDSTYVSSCFFLSANETLRAMRVIIKSVHSFPLNISLRTLFGTFLMQHRDSLAGYANGAFPLDQYKTSRQLSPCGMVTRADSEILRCDLTDGGRSNCLSHIQKLLLRDPSSLELKCLLLTSIISERGRRSIRLPACSSYETVKNESLLRYCIKLANHLCEQLPILGKAWCLKALLTLHFASGDSEIALKMADQLVNSDFEGDPEFLAYSALFRFLICRDDASVDQLVFACSSVKSNARFWNFVPIPLLAQMGLQDRCKAILELALQDPDREDRPLIHAWLGSLAALVITSSSEQQPYWKNIARRSRSAISETGSNEGFLLVSEAISRILNQFQ